jgi:hypothetical protein
MPETVGRGRDDYLRVDYDRLGVTFETYDRWIASGARVPTFPDRAPNGLDERGSGGCGRRSRRPSPSVNARYQNS